MSFDHRIKGFPRIFPIGADTATPADPVDPYSPYFPFVAHLVATILVAADGSGDFEDIQDGINALPSAGGHVYIKDGTYKISSSITISNNNIALIGSGKATRIQSSADITLILVGAVSGVLIERVFLHGSGSGSSQGIFLNGTSDSTVEDCWIENMGDTGITSSGANNNVIMSNYISSCGSAAIYIHDSDYNVIGSNILTTSLIGIYFFPSNGDLAHNNIITACDYEGLVLAGSDYCVISNNQIYLNGRDGILLSPSQNSVITGNLVLNNSKESSASYDGIRLLAGAIYNVIAGNNCSDLQAHPTQGYGIAEDSDADNHNEIVGNVLRGNKTGPLNIQGANTFVLNLDENLVIGTGEMHASAFVTTSPEKYKDAIAKIRSADILKHETVPPFGEKKTVNLGELVSLLLSGEQELIKKVERLEEKIKK